MHIAAFICSFAVLAVASVIPTSSQDTLAHPRDVLSDPCKVDVGDINAIQSMLNTVGPIDQLDIYLNASFWQHETNWLDAYWNLYFSENGANSVSGCTEIGGNCDLPSMNCSTYASPTSYWVLFSVYQLQSKLNIINNLLLWDGWIDSNTVTQIAKDFTVSPLSTSAYSWLSSAFTIAGAAVGAADVEGGGLAGGVLGFVSWGFGQAASNMPSDAVDPTQVYDALIKLVGGVATHFQDLLKDATGNGDPSALPIYTWTSLQHPTTQFFSDPHILQDVTADNNTLHNTWIAFAGLVEQKLVNVAMQSAYYVLLGDNKDYNTESACNALGNSLWAAAGNGDMYCWYFTAPTDSAPCSNDDPSTCDVSGFMTPTHSEDTIQLPSSIYSALSSTYNFTLSEYYNALLDCEFNGKGGAIDTSATVPWGGKTVSRCFFNMTVWEGYFHADHDISGDVTHVELVWSTNF